MVVIWVKRDGQTCKLPQPAANKLVKELRAGRGQSEMVRLMDNGYGEFVGADGELYPVDAMTLDLLGA